MKTGNIDCFLMFDFLRLSCFGLLILFVFGTVRDGIGAEPPGKGKTEECFRYLNTFHDRNVFSGNILVLKKQDTLLNFSSGYADAENQVRNQPKTLFHIGTAGQLFTGLMMLTLMEADSYPGFTTRLSEFYPEIKNADKISVDDLLMHRSGLPEVFYDNRLRKAAKLAGSDGVAAETAKLPNAFFPGSKFSYNPLNYVFLGYMQEAVTASSFSELVKKEIADPLSLSSLRLIRKAEQPKGLALGYTISGSEYNNSAEEALPALFGAEGLVINALDLACFLQSLFEDRYFLSATVPGQMTNIRDGYGRGMSEFRYERGTAFGHVGGMGNYACMALYFPEDSVTAVLMSNGSEYPVHQIMKGVLQCLSGSIPEWPTFQRANVSTSTLKTYAGRYVKDGFPVEVWVELTGNSLSVRLNDEDAFMLVPESDSVFYYYPSAAKIVFRPGGLIYEEGALRLEMKKRN